MKEISSIQVSKPLTNRLSSIEKSLEIPRGELESLVRLAEALWVDEEAVGKNLYEVYVAVVLKEADPEQQVSWIAQGLLTKAAREGDLKLRVLFQNNPEFCQTPFYMQPLLNRALLVAAHSQKWSYDRMIDFFEVSRDEFERLLWQSRLSLATQIPSLSKSHSLRGGANPSEIVYRPGSHCPEARVDQPWTQRFLDGEIQNARERAFLQNHLMACSNCLSALNSARDLYYIVEGALPLSKLSETFSQQLFEVSRQTFHLAMPAQRNFIESVKVFFLRKEARFAASILLGLVVWAALKTVF